MLKFIKFTKLSGMKTLLKLLGFFIVVNFLTIGCTKIALDEKVEDITDGGAFNQANVKEWYYAVFKKSAEWKSSPEAGKKLPIWGEGFYRKVGDMEIIEFPLWKHTKVYSTLFPMGAIISEQEKERVVKSALHRIIFLRDGNGKVYVREQVFTPSYEYARKKNYDFTISQR